MSSSCWILLGGETLAHLALVFRKEHSLRRLAGRLVRAGLVLLAAHLVLHPKVAVSWAPVLARANRTKIRYDLQKLGDAVEAFRKERSGYPATLEEMMRADAETRDTFCHLPPEDPWGNPYLYRLTARGPVISCLGRDGRPGGTGDDRDYHYPEP